MLALKIIVMSGECPRPCKECRGDEKVDLTELTSRKQDEDEVKEKRDHPC